MCAESWPGIACFVYLTELIKAEYISSAVMRSTSVRSKVKSLKL